MLGICQALNRQVQELQLSCTFWKAAYAVADGGVNGGQPHSHFTSQALTSTQTAGWEMSSTCVKSAIEIALLMNSPHTVHLHRKYVTCC